MATSFGGNYHMSMPLEEYWQSEQQQKQAAIINIGFWQQMTAGGNIKYSEPQTFLDSLRNEINEWHGELR